MNAYSAETKKPFTTADTFFLLLCAVVMVCLCACDNGGKGDKPATTSTIAPASTTTTMPPPPGTTTTTAARNPGTGLTGPAFEVEPGIRIDYAGNAKGGYNDDPSLGRVGTYVYHEDKSHDPETGEGGGSPGSRYAFSEDGITFEDAVTVEMVAGVCSDNSNATYYFAHPERLELPDGSGWRMYFLTFRRDEASGIPLFTGLMSSFSTDGIYFCSEEGSRYGLGPNDENTMGVYTTFVAEHADEPQVVLLYLGDLAGNNNARRAVAGADGYTFTWERDNVLNDATGRASDAYVDISTVPTGEPGKRRLYGMQGGTAIYSFITDDDARTFTMEEGPRISADDFDIAVTEGRHVCNLYDPSLVQYRDENGDITMTRMYVTGNVWDETLSWESDGQSGSCKDVEACAGDVKYDGCYLMEALFSAVSYD